MADRPMPSPELAARRSLALCRRRGHTDTQSRKIIDDVASRLLATLPMDGIFELDWLTRVRVAVQDSSRNPRK